MEISELKLNMIKMSDPKISEVLQNENFLFVTKENKTYKFKAKEDDPTKIKFVSWKSKNITCFKEDTSSMMVTMILNNM